MTAFPFGCVQSISTIEIYAESYIKEGTSCKMANKEAENGKTKFKWTKAVKIFGLIAAAALIAWAVCFLVRSSPQTDVKVIGDDGWAAEVRSVTNDGSVGEIVIGITAPEHVNLTPKVQNLESQDYLTPGNNAIVSEHPDVPDLIVPSNGVCLESISFSWEEDGDGLDNTKNYVIRVTPDAERSTADPFGASAGYSIHIEDIVRRSKAGDFLKDWLLGNRQGKVRFVRTNGLNVYSVETLADRTWDFTVTFSHAE